MDRDEEFVEYVEMRWSLLYRFAVLLAGERYADELTRAGLVSAHTIWDDVVESGSRDSYVKELIADRVADRIRSENRTAVAATIAQRAAHLVPGSAEPDRLHDQIDALPLGQRAVLGLRCFADRGDPEDRVVVGTLGLDAEEEDRLAADALATVLGADQSEQDVFYELRRRAAELLPPLPPVTEILVQSRQARAKRRRRHGSITAAVVAALLGTSLLVAATDQKPGTRTGPPFRPVVPSGMDEVPLGTPPRTAYSSGNVLDFGRAEVTLPEEPIALAKAGSDVVITYPGGRIELFDSESRSRSLLAAESEGTPVVDPDGHWVAWQHPAPEQGVRPAVVVAVSLTGKGRYRRTFGVATTCCPDPFLVNGITSAGQLIASAPLEGRTWVWELDGPQGPGPVRPLDGMDRLVVTRVAGDLVVVLDRSGPAFGATVGTVVGDTFRIQFSTDRREPDFGVPGWVVYSAWDGTLRARRLAWSSPLGMPRQREVTLRLPAGLIRTGMRRESGTTVVMDVQSPADADPSSAYLVRCDLASGSCLKLARLTGSHQLAE